MPTQRPLIHNRPYQLEFEEAKDIKGLSPLIYEPTEQILVTTWAPAPVFPPVASAQMQLGWVKVQ